MCGPWPRGSTTPPLPFHSGQQLNIAMFFINIVFCPCYLFLLWNVVLKCLALCLITIIAAYFLHLYSICLPHLLICICLISSPIACPPSSVLCWCLWRFFLFFLFNLPTFPPCSCCCSYNVKLWRLLAFSLCWTLLTCVENLLKGNVPQSLL